MIERVIEAMIAMGQTRSSEEQLKTCFNAVVGYFDDEESRFKLNWSSLSPRVESTVNLVLSPESGFATLFEIDEELAESWYVLNGLHHFQMAQFFRYREATVLRFVCSIFTGSAVTGSIFILGDHYSALAAKYEAEHNALPSWIGTTDFARSTSGS
jgi:hypothetical protein